MTVIEFLFQTPPIIYSAGSLFFVLNWINTVYNYMSNAIVKIDLHEDGKTVTLTYKGGKSVDTQVKNIYKKTHEKALVETFEESYLFPITIKEGANSKNAFILGQS